MGGARKFDFFKRYKNSIKKEFPPDEEINQSEINSRGQIFFRVGMRLELFKLDGYGVARENLNVREREAICVHL